MPRSVTPDSVPLLLESTIVSPPVMRSLLLVSMVCTVIVVLATPLATKEVSVGVMVVVLVLAGPGKKVTLAVLVTASPSIVALTVAVPAVVAA